MPEGAVLLHVWSIDPAQEAAGIDRLDELFGRIGSDPGFLSARILESEDQTSVAAVIEMRTIEDRQRLDHLPEVRETLDHIAGAWNVILRLYHEVKAYPPQEQSA